MTIRAGVVGSPAKHSLSPIIHTAWLEAAGIDGRYEIFDLPRDGFADFIKWARAEGVGGVNVTIPFKEEALTFAEAHNRSPGAVRAGAANLLCFNAEGEIRAANTDGEGIRYAVFQTLGRTPASPEEYAGMWAGPAVVLGAGGAARSAVAMLAHNCPDIRVVNRTMDRAQALADQFPDRVRAMPWEACPEALEGASILINATSLGMTGQPPLNVILDPLPQTAIVLDMVYRPLETPLLAAARARGNPTADGLAMLIGQAEPSFAAIFGKLPDRRVDVRALCLAELERRGG